MVLVDGKPCGDRITVTPGLNTNKALHLNRMLPCYGHHTADRQQVRSALNLKSLLISVQPLDPGRILKLHLRTTVLDPKAEMLKEGL